MNYYSASSRQKLDTCHPLLRKLFEEVLQDDDHKILYGYRSIDTQHALFMKGRELIDGKVVVVDRNSIVTNCDGYIKTSMHNYTNNGRPEALAVDAVPCDVASVFFDDKSVAYFAGKVMQKSRELGIPLRWGGDWDNDANTQNQTLHDLVHFELKGVI